MDAKVESMVGMQFALILFLRIILFGNLTIVGPPNHHKDPKLVS
jgi:hypothetical protein